MTLARLISLAVALLQGCCRIIVQMFYRPAPVTESNHLRVVTNVPANTVTLRTLGNTTIDLATSLTIAVHAVFAAGTHRRFVDTSYAHQHHVFILAWMDVKV